MLCSCVLLLLLVHNISGRTYGQTGGQTDRPMYVRRSANLNAHPKVCRVHKQSVLLCVCTIRHRPYSFNDQKNSLDFATRRLHLYFPPVRISVDFALFRLTKEHITVASVHWQQYHLSYHSGPYGNEQLCTYRCFNEFTSNQCVVFVCVLFTVNV